jgi:hypothetical protein
MLAAVAAAVSMDSQAAGAVLAVAVLVQVTQAHMVSLEPQERLILAVVVAVLV